MLSAQKVQIWGLDLARSVVVIIWGEICIVLIELIDVLEVYFFQLIDKSP